MGGRAGGDRRGAGRGMGKRKKPRGAASCRRQRQAPHEWWRLKGKKQTRPESPFCSFLATTRQPALTPSPTKGSQRQARSDLTQACRLQGPAWVAGAAGSPASPPSHGPRAGGAHRRQGELPEHPADPSAVHCSPSCLPIIKFCESDLSSLKGSDPPVSFYPSRQAWVLIIGRRNVGGIAGNKALQPKSSF